MAPCAREKAVHDLSYLVLVYICHRSSSNKAPSEERPENTLCFFMQENIEFFEFRSYSWEGAEAACTSRDSR